MDNEDISQFANDQKQSILDLMQKSQKFVANFNNETFRKILDEEVRLNTTQSQSHETIDPERPLLDSNILASLFRQKGLLDRLIAKEQATEILYLQQSDFSEEQAIDVLAKDFREKWVHNEHDFIRDYLVAPAAILIVCVVASASFAKAREKCSSSDQEIEQNDPDQLPLPLQEIITKIATHSQFEIPHQKSELFQQIYDAIDTYESGDISKIISNADSKVAIEMLKILSVYLTTTTLPLVFAEQCLAGLSLHESAQVHQDAIKAGVIKGSIVALCCKFIAFKEAEQKMSALFEQDEAGKFILNAELFEKFQNEYPKQAEKLLNLSVEYQQETSSATTTPLDSPRTGRQEASPLMKGPTRQGQQ